MIFKTVFKEIEGFASNNDQASLAKLEVRITHDKKGATLSIGNGETMFVIGVEELAPYIIKGEKTRRVTNGFRRV